MRNSLFYISVSLIGMITILAVYVVSRTFNQANVQPKDFSSGLEAPELRYQTEEVVIVGAAPVH